MQSVIAKPYARFHIGRFLEKEYHAGATKE